MNTVFKNCEISGIVGVLPENCYEFFDEMEDGESPRNKKIAKNMGYGRRYRAKKETTTSDLYIYGLKHMLSEGIVSKDDIGAIVVVTFTPDYYVPQVSNLIQGECGLPKDVFTVDIWDGCAGYINGLIHSFMYLNKMEKKKVLLFCGDVICRGGGEKYSIPKYGGDGAAITIIEKNESDSENLFLWETDGANRELIMFDQGAFYDIYHENKLKRDAADMDPNASFRYFQKIVPDSFRRFCDLNNITKGSVDRFFFIQANRLAVKKYIDALDLPVDKVRMDLVEKYGDMSAALNPIGIIDELKDLINEKAYDIMIIGYGAGIRWGIAKMSLSKGMYLSMIQSNL